jgi:CheY-like chemotaxis protein
MISTKRVLLVEDFEDSRTGLSKLLESEGYEVLQAADGAEAIEVALHSRPDIILMDLTLPVVDGLTATRKIKEIEYMSRVPVIALTAHDPEDVRQMVSSAGCTDFVTKPVNFSTLVALISSYLSK